MPRIALLPITLLLLAAAPGPIRYVVDTEATSVSAKVAFLGLASKTARFPKVTGGATLSPADPQSMRLDVSLDARALQAPDRVTLRRLRGEKSFWVEKYPTVRFRGERPRTHRHAARPCRRPAYGARCHPPGAPPGHVRYAAARCGNRRAASAHRHDHDRPARVRDDGLFADRRQEGRYRDQGADDAGLITLPRRDRGRRVDRRAGARSGRPRRSFHRA